VDIEIKYIGARLKAHGAGGRSNFVNSFLVPCALSLEPRNDFKKGVILHLINLFGMLIK
jgi:hypothetical protein